MITMSRQQQRLKTSQQLLFTTAGLGLRQIPLHQAAADIERHLLRSRASDDTPGRPGPSSGEGSNEEKLADFQDSSNRQETPIDQVLSSKKQMARNPARQIQPEIENRSHIFGGEVFPAVAVPNMPGLNSI
jgi:hypothetical protein